MHPRTRSSTVIAHFKSLPDYRGRVGIYPLFSLVAIVLLAHLCGAPRGQKDLEKFAAGLSQAQRRALGIRRQRDESYPAPSQPTFHRLMDGLDGVTLEKTLLRVQSQIRGEPPADELIDIDGKKPRHGRGVTIPGEGGTWHGTVVDLIGGRFSTAPAVGDAETGGASGGPQRPAVLSGYRYEVRADVPRCFKTQVVSPDKDATEEDCAQRFIVSSRDIVEALAARVRVQARTQEVFTGQIELAFINAEMDPNEAAKIANRALQRDGI